MYAKTDDDLQAAIAKLKEGGLRNYVERVEKFLERQEEWVMAHRMDVLYRGHNTNNFAEVSIRIIKDIVLCRTKAYNAYALIDFIVSVYEEYFRRRILHYAFNREANPRKIFDKLCRKLPPGN